MLRRVLHFFNSSDFELNGNMPYQAKLVDWHAKDCAVFDLSSDGNVYPSGWVLIDSRLRHSGSCITAKFYYDTGNGFRDADSISVVVTRKGRIHDLFQFPPKVVGLRLQLMNVTQPIELQPFIFRKIGFVERLWRMYRRTIPMLFSYSRNRRRRIGLTLWRLVHDLSGANSVAAQLRLTPPDFSYRKWLYAKWIRKHEALTQHDLMAIKQHIAQMSYPPLISVVMPVYDPPVGLLCESIDSVLNQLYPHFELCIADDASINRNVKSILDEYALRDHRIKVDFRARNGHICAASNSALSLAKGSFVALLDHDDLLAPLALYRVAVEILQHPDAEIIYSDEDKINEDGERIDPYCKPDWNSQLALSHNFVSHLGVYRTDTLRQIGGFREGYEGSQDYDLMLRVAARVQPEQIRHIPSILYHWRVRLGSTSLGNSEKDYAWDAGRRAIEDYLSRQGIKAAVFRSPNPDFYRVHYDLPAPHPKVSVIIPVKNHSVQLRRCVERLIELTIYKNYEVIIVDNGSIEPAAVEYLGGVRERSGFRVLSFLEPFNYPAMNNMAAAVAEGDVLCFLNSDIEVITASWMEEMLGCLMQRGVGVVGARLLYANNTVLHAGVILTGRDTIAMHAHAFISKDDWGYAGRACIAQDFSAVTGACMMVRRTVFEDLNGLDEVNLGEAFSDVDFCLRAGQAGWRVVYTPYAELCRHELAVLGRKKILGRKASMRREVKFMQKQWGQKLMHDPSYNQNLSKIRPDFSLNKKAILERPWLNG